MCYRRPMCLPRGPVYCGNRVRCRRTGSRRCGRPLRRFSPGKSAWAGASNIRPSAGGIMQDSFMSRRKLVVATGLNDYFALTRSPTPRGACPLDPGLPKPAAAKRRAPTSPRHIVALATADLGLPPTRIAFTPARGILPVSPACRVGTCREVRDAMADLASTRAASSADSRGLVSTTP